MTCTELLDIKARISELEKYTGYIGLIENKIL